MRWSTESSKSDTESDVRQSSLCWVHLFLLRMKAEIWRNLKEIYSLAKIMLVFVICFQARTLAKFNLFKNWKAWAGEDQNYTNREAEAVWFLSEQSSKTYSCISPKISEPRVFLTVFFAVWKGSSFHNPEDLGPQPGALPTSWLNVVTARIIIYFSHQSPLNKIF